VDLHDAVSEAPLLPGLVLEERVARTNLSEVWRGRRSHDGAQVAVKLPLSPSGAEALRLEADTVQALERGGLTGIVHAEFVADPAPHLVLPWMGRRTLRDVIGEIRGGGARSNALRIYYKVLRTVAMVDMERFLHGDLKPENILIDDRGDPWLTDFGMARHIRNARLDSHVSRSMSIGDGEWGGTLHYLPPEGLQGEAPTRSWDVYAMGVILHEILLGRRPDRAATPEALRALLPEKVVDVLLHALAYSPEDRIASTQELAAELESVRFELTARGPAKWGLRGMRLCLAGLAAFFVMVRYVSVFALLLSYIAIGVLAYCKETGGFFLFLYIPVLAFHAVVRWEGPESPEEARLRKSGAVVSKS